MTSSTRILVIILSLAVSFSFGIRKSESQNRGKIECGRSQCSNKNIADAEAALRIGMEEMQYGLSHQDFKALANAKLEFSHGYAQSADSRFLLLLTRINLKAGECNESRKNFKKLAEREKKKSRFSEEMSVLKSEFRALQEECAWRGSYSPKAVRKKLDSLNEELKKQGELIVRVGVQDGLAFHHSNQHSDAYEWESSQMSLRTVFLKNGGDLAGGGKLSHLGFRLRFPQLNTKTWSVFSEAFLLRDGAPEIERIRLRDGILCIRTKAMMTKLVAQSGRDICQQNFKRPKACEIEMAAALPIRLEIDLRTTAKVKTNCKDKSLARRKYLCR